MDGITPDPRGGIIVGEGEIRWWTFAGGRINSTLRHALEALGCGVEDRARQLRVDDPR
jgi:ATP-dependent Lhr-like helicase